MVDPMVDYFFPHVKHVSVLLPKQEQIWDALYTSSFCKECR